MQQQQQQQQQQQSKDVRISYVDQLIFFSLFISDTIDFFDNASIGSLIKRYNFSCKFRFLFPAK
jgi:ABC-type multidrug transport system fused ATPase/permease subunit